MTDVIVFTGWLLWYSLPLARWRAKFATKWAKLWR
jgi:hypothetical protein